VLVPNFTARAKLRLRKYGSTYPEKMVFWRDRLRSGYFEHTYGPEQIEKSEAIARAFRVHSPETQTVHEIGVGAGRNLHYLLRDRPALAVSGNDLDKEQCFKFMQPDVQRALTFVQKDTRSFLHDEVEAGRSVDAVLTSDHLIHIPPDGVEDILDLMQRYAARTIVFHEAVRRKPERTDDFWWAHDYAALERDFELVHEEEREPVHFSEYVLRVYRRRGT
jgi:SAM-dependent methyltransferase